MLTISLSGEVGSPTFCTYQVRDLPPEPVRIMIDSAGGCTVTGLAVHSLLMDHPHQVTCEIIRAGSAAVLPALAGDHRIIHGDGSFFLHLCAGAAIGNCDTLENAARDMRAQDLAYAELVSARTGQEMGKVQRLMKSETTLSAQQAIALGFVHEILGLAEHRDYPRANPLKTALASIGIQERMTAPDGSPRLSEAYTSAMALPAVAAILDSPNRKCPELEPTNAATALDSFVEGQARETQIKRRLVYRLRQRIDQGGLICWPLRISWTCSHCSCRNYHPPTLRRFATPCRECGLPLSPTLEEPPT